MTVQFQLNAAWFENAEQCDVHTFTKTESEPALPWVGTTMNTDKVVTMTSQVDIVRLSLAWILQTDVYYIYVYGLVLRVTYCCLTGQRLI